MAVVKKESLSVIPASSVTVVQRKKPQKILDEDTYTKVVFTTKAKIRMCKVPNSYLGKTHREVGHQR